MLDTLYRAQQCCSYKFGITWKDDKVLTDLKDGSGLSEPGNGAEAAKVNGEW